MPAETDKPLERTDRVQSLARGLSVIRAFGAERREMRLSQVADATGLTRAAARRFLLTLAELGYVRVDDGRFSLRPRVLDLGYSYLSGLGFTDIAQPHMEELVGKLSESVSIAVLDETEVVYVGRVPTERIMTINLTVGTRLPAYATSMGRVLLAGLPASERRARLAEIKPRKLTPFTLTTKKALEEEITRVAEQGYAIVDQELEIGLRSAAVPLLDAGGDPVALNVSVHASRTEVDELRKRHLPEVQRTAKAIEADLQATGSRGSTRR